jgi:hypothetical protein
MGCPRQGRSRGLSVPAITSYPSDLTAALAGWIPLRQSRVALPERRSPTSFDPVRRWDRIFHDRKPARAVQLSPKDRLPGP